MTRLEMLRRLFPNATIQPDGYPTVMPCKLGDCPFPEYNMPCNENGCFPAFWNEETGFGLIKNDEEVKL